ncbi:hypothetical protein [Rhizorhabdus sp.]|uniref:hypothetical protein n=1 Tax=Rhizorhabdus sp. TaxID=1968843 RepID=UPI0035B01D0D
MMERLNADLGPFWRDILPGVRVQFRPIEPRDWRAAKRAAREALESDEGASDTELIELAGDAFSRELIRRGIVAWEGVGDADGNVIEPTQDVFRVDDQGKPVRDEAGRLILQQRGSISLFLADPRRFEACDLAYVVPLAERSREGNASAGSPNGTSVMATPASATASSAAPPQAGDAAPNVPTASKRRKATKAKPSGR